jgi:hypothetical protein
MLDTSSEYKYQVVEENDKMRKISLKSIEEIYTWYSMSTKYSKKTVIKPDLNTF